MDKLMTRKQYDVWLKKLPKDVCTFCEWNKYQVILKEFGNWVWIANIAPYWEYHTMIIPKRHFVKYSDMTRKEADELVTVIDYGERKIIDAKLTTDKGVIVEKTVYFWRNRHNLFDPVSGTVRPAHFHLQLSPDIDHRWDSTVNKNAHRIDITILR